MLASAHNVRAVLAGRSLSDSLAQTTPALRAPAQAIAFHVMRHLGLARQIRQMLLRRTPPDPVFDALLLVALSLADTAAAHARPAGSQRAGASFHVHAAGSLPAVCALLRVRNPGDHAGPHSVTFRPLWAMLRLLLQTSQPALILSANKPLLF